MVDHEEIWLAKELSNGGRRALFAMTREFQHPGRATFNASAAYNLAWAARDYGGLVEYALRDRRFAYRITPLGERIRERLVAMGYKP